MTKIPYWQKLQDPRWQKKRLEIMERDQFQCQCCNDSSSPLHVHHFCYFSGFEPWDYGNWNFLTLCESCHKRQSTFDGDYDPINQLCEAIHCEGFVFHEDCNNLTGAIEEWKDKGGNISDLSQMILKIVYGLVKVEKVELV